MKFECQEVFMVRTPSLPLECLIKYNNQEKDIYNFIKSDSYLDDFFKKALLIASKSLYNSYINKPKDPNKYSDLNKSLLKYFIRSVTRTTPFGYFADVSLGNFSVDTNLIKGDIICDLKVDNEWLNSLIYQIEMDIVEELSFYFNQNCYISGNRIKNPNFTNHGKMQRSKGEDIVKESSIRYTGLVKLIKDLGETFISYGSLKKTILAEYKNVPDPLVKQTILVLLENEYLYSNLRIPTYCENGLKYLIDQLRCISYSNNTIQVLVKVNELIEEYKQSEQLEILEYIYKNMSELCESKNYLILNLGNKFLTNTLDQEIKKRVEKLADLLYKIPVKLKAVDKFKMKFMDKYGSNVEVPFTTIIDENDFNGLSYWEPDSFQDTEQEVIINSILDKKIFQAILQGEKEVSLTEDDFSEVLQMDLEYSKTLDLNMKVMKINGENKLYLGGNIGSKKAGAMFERFSDCFDSKDLSAFSLIHPKIEELYSNEYVLVEVREQLSFGELNNVLNNYKNYKYYITFGNCFNEYENEIKIDDLLVGVSAMGDMYIKSKRLNQKLKIITDNMLNNNLNNKVLQLLLSISESSDFFPEWRLTSLVDSSKFPYTPRINMEGVIVSPRKWVLTDIDLKSSDFATFINKLELCKRIFKIDNILYQTVSDNRILVDLNDKECLEILYLEYKKMGD